MTGTVVMLSGAMPDGRTLALALLYSIGAHGIMTLNDFKSIEGDRQMGVGSLPVRLGAQGAARVACGVMLLSQCVVVGLLFNWQTPNHAIAVGMLTLIQGALMLRFVMNPIQRATWYSALGINFYVSGMMVSAFAVRGINQAAGG
jgi:chlorophyll synthase